MCPDMPGDEWQVGDSDELFDKEANPERKEQIARLVFEMVQYDHGPSRPGEERESWDTSKRVSERISKALELGEIEVPYELLQQLKTFLSQIEVATGFRDTSYPETVGIIYDVLARHFENLNPPQHDPYPYLEKMMRAAFGEEFDGRVLEMVRGVGAEQSEQIAEAFGKLPKFYEIFRSVLNSNKESFSPEENIEDRETESYLSSDPIVEALENYTLEELRQQPLRTEDVLMIIAGFNEGMPIKWSECTQLEQGIIRKIMDEAAGSKPGATVVDSPEGPIITAEKDEN